VKAPGTGRGALNGGVEPKRVLVGEDMVKFESIVKLKLSSGAWCSDVGSSARVYSSAIAGIDSC
jgi:hypothetical protein